MRESRIIALTIMIILLLSTSTLPALTQTQQTIKENTYDYVIITTNSIEEESLKLDDFIHHKELLGFHVLVVTEDDFDELDGEYPNQRPDKIRQWLINNYQEMDIEYVLLIGDPTTDGKTPYSIPMKLFKDKFSVGLSLFFFWPVLESPSDYYYADLDSNWNFIAKEYCGDFFDFLSANINLEPEVYIGRIPIYDGNIGILDVVLQKTIDYEFEKDITWRTNVLSAYSFYDFDYDGAIKSQQIINNVIIPNNFSYWRMYQQGSHDPRLDSIYDSEEELRGGTVINRWKNDAYGIVLLGGHGNASCLLVGISDMFSIPPIEYDGMLITYDQIESLDNAHPAVVFLDACSAGQPEEPNIGYALLQYGGISVICASRIIWYSTDRLYDYKIDVDVAPRMINKLIQNHSIGEAFYLSKAEIGDEIREIRPLYLIGSPFRYVINLLRINLYGDPSVTLLN